jgi:hypothetical protein
MMFHYGIPGKTELMVEGLTEPKVLGVNRTRQGAGQEEIIPVL